jgi:hypothetical protein
MNADLHSDVYKILFQGLKTSVTQILTLVCGFLTICKLLMHAWVLSDSLFPGVGITVLQMSKVDPTQLNKLDRKSTILLQAARSGTENAEKSITGLEDPGIDTLRGSFGTMGSIIRARSARRLSKSSRSGPYNRQSHASGAAHSSLYGHDGLGSHLPGIGGFQRHQLYDPPVPSFAREGSAEEISLKSRPSTMIGTVLDPTRTAPRTPTIKFDAQDVAHYYPRPGAAGGPRHEHIRAAANDGQRTVRDFGPRLPPPTPDSGHRLPPEASEEQSTPRATGKWNRAISDEQVKSMASSSVFPRNTPAVPDTSSQARHGPQSSGDGSPSTQKGRRSPHKHYPRSKKGDDAEERLALVHQGHSRGDSDSTGGSDSETTPVELSGIRLVSSKTVI